MINCVEREALLISLMLAPVAKEESLPVRTTTLTLESYSRAKKVSVSCLMRGSERKTSFAGGVIETRATESCIVTVT